MNKYIVKNCNRLFFDKYCAETENHIHCESCINCIIKKIIEECKHEIDFSNKVPTIPNMSVANFAEHLLTHFEIKEIKE